MPLQEGFLQPHQLSLGSCLKLCLREMRLRILLEMQHTLLLLLKRL